MLITRLIATFKHGSGVENMTSCDPVIQSWKTDHSNESQNDKPGVVFFSSYLYLFLVDVFQVLKKIPANKCRALPFFRD